jgi:hypothetical protein
MPDHECRENLDCRDEQIRRLRAALEDAEIDLRNSRDYNGQLMARFAKYEGTEQDRRRAWAQQILRHADDLDWGPSQIAAYVAGIASEVHDA